MKGVLLLFALLLGTSSIATAERIQTFSAIINIEQSGELSIVESILYDFETASKHGIYRDIPFMIKNSGVKRDIDLHDFSVKMDGKPVKWSKTTLNSTHAGKIIRLKIGSPERFVTGKHGYQIVYRVKLGVLPASTDKKLDAIRWNVVGTGWKVPIENIIAEFTLPSLLDSSSVKTYLYTGSYGQTNSDASSEWIDSRHLKVHAQNLKPHEGLTAELIFQPSTLGQSGLENTTKIFWQQIMDTWHWAALFGFLLFFYKKLNEQAGFVDKRSIAVQYQPPKGLSLLQSGLLLDKRADTEDFAAAILELAQLGYIEIHQKNRKENPTLKRTDKKISNLTDNQVYLLNHLLFSNGSSYTIASGSELKASALQSAFGKINNDLYSWSVADGYMYENPKRARSRFLKTALLALLPVLALTLYTVSIKMGIDSVALILFSSVFIVAGLFVFFQKGIFVKVFGIVFAGMGGGIPLASAFSQSDTEVVDILIGPIGVLLILVLAATYTYRRIGKFTPKGAAVQKHILGLEKFTKRVKEDEIKRRLARDPLYLDRLLPYAILFGKAKHWLSLYDLTKVSTPAWYHGEIGGISNFGNSISRAVASPSNSSSGGGGFSGNGGFSGGGGGGGGGGSW